MDTSIWTHVFYHNYCLFVQYRNICCLDNTEISKTKKQIAQHLMSGTASCVSFEGGFAHPIELVKSESLDV